jgi:streptogramin lyase
MPNMKVISAFTALIATLGLATAASTPRKEHTPSRDPTNEAVKQFDTPCGKASSGMVLQNEGLKGCVDVWDPTEGDKAKGKSLADTLTLDRRGRVWWDYAREVDAIVCPTLLMGGKTDGRHRG